MKWPFGRRNREERMVRVPTVTLTDDEHRECQAYLRSVIPQSDEGAWYMPKEVADLFERSMIASCMMGRAGRFAMAKRFAEACQAAAKACSIDPSCTNCYEFARILEAAGNEAEARMMFAEFLRRYEADQQSQKDRNPDLAAKIESDLAMLVSYARTKTGMLT